MATGESRRRAVDAVPLVFERTREPMLIVDDARRHLAANEAASRALGIPRSELLRMCLDDLLAPTDRSRMAERWPRLHRDGRLRQRLELRPASCEALEVDCHVTADIAPGQHLSILVPGAMADGAAPTVRGEQAVDAACEEPPVHLTQREREVIQLLAAGATNIQIAQRLGIAEATVQHHIDNAKNKLGAITRAQAIAIAARSGLLDD